MERLKFLKNHLLLGTLFFVLTLIQQYLFYLIKGLPIVWLDFSKYLATFIFFFVVTFAKSNNIRFFFLTFIMFLNFFQMAHISYFGTQFLPSGVYLLFTQMGEVKGTLKEELHHVWFPFLMTFIPIFIGKKFHDKLNLKWSSFFVSILFFLYLIYNPLRTYFTGNSWGRQPSTRELTGFNAYLSVSYFLGKILPHKLSSQTQDSKNISTELKFIKNSASPWDMIIIVLGESLTHHHMQLYGYPRPTTPFLDKLKKNKNFHYVTGLSSGVSTDISVAFFLNLGYGSAGAIKSAKGDHCLIKTAKKNGFMTYFFSSQSEQQLRYIIPYLCSKYLDNMKFLNHLAPSDIDENAASDDLLFKPLKEIVSLNDKQFIILNQRGSHAPWNLRFSPKAKIFEGSIDSRIDDYDNSVYEFDLFWKELDEILSSLNKKILVIYLSDHGESLGENSSWGHGFLGPRSFEVPFIFSSYGSDIPEKTKKVKNFFPQYNLALFITEELGITANQSSLDFPNDFEIYGNDIDGFAGKAKIKFDQNYNYQYSVEK